MLAIVELVHSNRGRAETELTMKTEVCFRSDFSTMRFCAGNKCDMRTLLVINYVHVDTVGAIVPPSSLTVCTIGKEPRESVRLDDTGNPRTSTFISM